MLRYIDTHRALSNMEIRDYNGTERWSLQSLRERYQIYARQLEVPAPLYIIPQKHEEHQIQWIFPVMFEVIQGIETGDRACIEIGVECIEENQWLAFGRIIKANIARFAVFNFDFAAKRKIAQTNHLDAY